MKVEAIGGVEDHMHVLLAIRCTNTVSECVQVLKAVSSKWLHDSFPDLAGFAWQQGYGAFSIGISQFRQTARYIEAQEQHHKRRTFEQEWALFLKRHNIPYDEEFFAP
jgi:REP element-mobilizing transposase RayT